MAMYNNTRKDAGITSVEFAAPGNGNFSFFYIDKAVHKDEIKQWLTQDIAQKIIAETEVSGHTVYVTQGEKTKEEILKAMETRGDSFKLHSPKKPFNSWKWRGILSMTGHPMQLISSFMLVDPFNATKVAHVKAQPKYGVNIGGKPYIRRPFDVAKGVFAVSNLAANLTNIFFGAQRSEDKHHLNSIKNQLNDELGEQIVTLEELINVNDKRAELRKGPEQSASIWEKFNGFMKRNSVIFGEIGLRYFGGVALVAPMKWENWKNGVKELTKLNPIEAFKKIKNPDSFIFTAGSFWLAGKTLAFFSKTPDPYNPEPKTWLDKFRENYVFKISTVTEAMGASTMAYDSFFRRQIKVGESAPRDYLGGVGGVLFALAFVMRLSAPYGVKELNMEEVYAHATDTLAKTPPEKLPQLMADSAATIKENLKGQSIEFGEVFTNMMKDFNRYHEIAPDSPVALPEIQAEKLATNPVVKPAITQRSPLERATLPASSHADAAKAAKNTPLTLGV